MRAINLCGLFGSNDAPCPCRRRAEHCSWRGASAGCEALVHVSAIGAEPEARRYGRTKGEGEDAVRELSRRDVVRPSLVFGPEDDLTNRFAGMARLPFLPVIAAKRKFQPVYVRDLGKAIAMAALDPRRFGGPTYEIGGPQ